MGPVTHCHGEPRNASDLARTRGVSPEARAARFLSDSTPLSGRIGGAGGPMGGSRSELMGRDLSTNQEKN